MKKITFILAIVLSTIAGKCYYQYNQTIKYLDTLQEYGYSYKITDKSFYHMNVTLKITDPKKVIKLYPKFIQENKKFVQKLETNLNKSIKQLNKQLYHISFSPLTFDVTVKNTLKYTTNDTITTPTN